MSRPSASSWRRLKVLARFLLEREKVIWKFGWQDEAGGMHMELHTDSDWAGRVRSRKSTSGGVVLRGAHLIKHWSSTRAKVALSSAEAELIAIVRGASEGLGIKGLAADFNVVTGVSVHADATAALGICKRTGVGEAHSPPRSAPPGGSGQSSCG